ncbi:MAG TPA: hypothetical protein DEP28_04570, partial [Bacteroidetes bacterium]|nr:hypothetical protein [Bacteroidota bacterium]
VQPDYFSFDAHEVLSYLPVQFKDLNTGFSDDWKAENNNEYNQSLQLRVFGDRTSRTDESSFDYRDPYNPTPQGSYIYQLVRNKTYADYMQPRAMMLAQPQIHANMEWKNATGKYWGNREPTNEEIQAQFGISITHGADGFSLFTYQSHSWPTYGSISHYSDMLKTHFPDTVEPAPADSFMFIGLLELNSPGRRIYNMYGQEKWDYVSAMNLKIQNWKPHLDKINWKSGWSVHSEGANHEFMTDIKSIYRNPQLEYDPEDDPEERFWEIGFYEPNPFLNPATDRSKYFVAVNRRCVPETTPGEGDYRKLKIRFNISHLQNFNNWKITDLNTGADVLTFDKNNDIYHNLGEFEPGEANLFKLSPVMQEGGTFVTNEEFGGLEIDCNDNVNNGGYNIDIVQGTTINFAEGKRIIMNGGEFTCGYSLIGNPSLTTVIMRGIDGEDWGGIEFNGCNLIKVNKTEFSKLKENTPSTSYILSAVDCPQMLIYNSTFTVESNRINCGAISSNFISEPNFENVAIDITGNYFDINGTGIPVVQVLGYSFNQIPVLIRWNTFEGDGNSNNAIFLSNVTGGIIRNNKIEGFHNGIHSAVSYIDFYNNEVSNTGYENYNLNLNAGSYFNLKSEMGNYYLGGYNKLNTSGDLASNIILQNSYFDADKGFNVFNVKSGSPHFTGTFNDDYFTTNDISIVDNCFKADNTPDYLNQDLSWEINISALNFYTGDNNCEIYSPESYEIVYFGDIEDTLWTKFVGIGGGSNENKGSNKVTEVTTGNLFKLKSDSLKVLMRKRKFNDVTRIGNEILNTYPDSAGLINVIQPVYFATLVTDDSIDTKITNYKTKLESVISTNGNNTSLVLRCNYFIQKCKVKLGEYQSALSGFQQIMQNFPYSWEGVVAGWDYSATQLLAGGGSGQGVKGNEDHELRELDEFHPDKFPINRDRL